MESKKYELTDETNAMVNNTKLYRIRALKDFDDVKKGQYGGFVESEKNLSQEGNCWIYGSNIVFGNAIVTDNAKVYGDSLVYGNAIVKDNAKICYCGEVHGNAVVGENAIVCHEVDEGYIDDYEYGWVYPKD